MSSVQEEAAQKYRNEVASVQEGPDGTGKCKAVHKEGLPCREEAPAPYRSATPVCLARHHHTFSLLNSTGVPGCGASTKVAG